MVSNSAAVLSKSRRDLRSPLLPAQLKPQAQRARDIPESVAGSAGLPERAAARCHGVKKKPPAPGREEFVLDISFHRTGLLGSNPGRELPVRAFCFGVTSN